MPGPLLGRGQVRPCARRRPLRRRSGERRAFITEPPWRTIAASPHRSGPRRRSVSAKEAESLTRLACGEKAAASFVRQAGSATRHATLGGFLGIRLARTRPVEWPVGSRVEMMRRIIPVIMCGGAGTRLWPSSRESFPKQFIPFFGPRSSFQDTVLRVSDPSLFGEPVIITGRDYSHLVADQLEGVGRTGTILLEPMRRDSGPAIAAAASFVRKRDPGSMLLVMAADHVIRDVPAFLAG